MQVVVLLAVAGLVTDKLRKAWLDAGGLNVTMDRRVGEVAGEIESVKYPGARLMLWPVTIVVVVGLMVACAPPVFYGLVNRILRKMKKPEVPREQWLSPGKVALAAVAFVPCWIFGGLAL